MMPAEKPSTTVLEVAKPSVVHKLEKLLCDRKKNFALVIRYVDGTGLFLNINNRHGRTIATGNTSGDVRLEEAITAILESPKLYEEDMQ